MSIFRDRYVLKDGTVIMPNKIHGITKNGSAYGIELHDGSYMLVAPSDIRTDRPTGMVDSTGESWYYENDKVIDTIEIGTGTIKMVLGEWRIVLDNPSTKYGSLPLSAFNERFTIIGMVPFEDER